MKRIQKSKHAPSSVRRPLRLLKHVRQSLQTQQKKKQQHGSPNIGRHAQALVRFLPKVAPDGTVLLVHEGGVNYRVNCYRVRYRCTQDFRDWDPRLGVSEGSVVEGTDEGNGWVKVQLTGHEHELVHEEIAQTNDWVLRHLTGMGVRKGLVEQVKKALAPNMVALNASSLKPGPTTMVEKVFGFAYTGEFNVDAYGLSGYIGSVSATASMTTEELGEQISKSSGIPVIHQRLASGTDVLKPGELMGKCGVSPVQNQITVLRTEEYPENPAFSFETLIDLLPGRMVPRSLQDWREVQADVWPGHPPLKDDWIRIVSRKSLTTYFCNVQTEETTFDYATARMDDP